MLKSFKAPRVILLVTTIALIPQVSNAWNLICGVSIRAVDDPDALQKWDADSYALKGISNYFYAVSELQRLELSDDGTVGVPTSLFGDTTAIEVAMQSLMASSENFSRALEIANVNGLGDDTGLGLLSSIQEQSETLKVAIEDEQLPSLQEFHELTALIISFIQHGVMLSNEHLNVGLSGHGLGGDQFTNFVIIQ